MGRKWSGIGLLLTMCFAVCAQADGVPQTARQALIEMLFSKTPGSLEKHLPEAMLAAVHTAPPGSPASMLGSFSVLTSQMQNRGGQFQSFEAGPILMTAEDPTTHSKLEAILVRDDLRGIKDEIEVSFRASKDGESQTAGISPRLTFAMVQEQGIWRLHDLTLAIGFSLTDANFLKALTTPVKPPQTVATTSVMQSPSANNVSFGAITTNESSATASIRAINTAQVSYAATYPDRGFACSLSAMGGMGSGSTPDEHHAMLLDPRLSNGRKNGYVFKISSCSGSPATSYAVIAAPADPSSGTKTFCSDQSAVLRTVPNGGAESCLSSGKPLN